MITEPPDDLFRVRSFGFYRYMFRTIRVSLLSEGINIDPVLRESGRMVGGALAPEITDTDLTTLLSRLKTFWEKNNLGRLEVESSTPLVLRVYDCFECGDLPDLGRPACAFDSGVLEAVFSRHSQGSSGRKKRPATRWETTIAGSSLHRCDYSIGSRHRIPENKSSDDPIDRHDTISGFCVHVAIRCPMRAGIRYTAIPPP